MEGRSALILCFAAWSMTSVSAGEMVRRSVKSAFCIDKFEIYRNHTICLGNPSQRLSRSGLNHALVNEIEDEHNNVRKNVKPTARKMMELSYSLPLEMEAQIWADSCAFRHDDPYFRFIPGRYTVGQNIYIGQDMNWTAVIGLWAREERYLKYNQTGNDKTKVGNYTQMVNADTTMVGCGKRNCGKSYFYVCNYAPCISDDHTDRPYDAGDTTVGCQGQFSNRTSQLCSCRGKVCINGGTLDMGTCNCTCVAGVKNYGEDIFGEDICELNCTKDGDHSDCKTMQESDCRTDTMTRFKCPWLCKVCPFAGRGYRQGSVRMPWETTTAPSTTTMVRMPWETTTAPSTTTMKVDNSAQSTSTVKVDNSAQQGTASIAHGSVFLIACMGVVEAIILLV